MGGYMCTECGETEDFVGYQDYNETGSARVFFDGDGTVQDWGDRDSSDTEYGEITDMECSMCNSESVEWVNSDEELERKSKKLRRIYNNEETKPEQINWKKRFKN